MEVVFISGKYRGNGYDEISKNIDKARQASIDLWKQGYAVICPHMNTAHFDGVCSDDVWLNGDIEILKRCDIVYFLDNWKESIGSKEEYNVAKRFGIRMMFQ